MTNPIDPGVAAGLQSECLRGEGDYFVIICFGGAVGSGGAGDMTNVTLRRRCSVILSLGGERSREFPAEMMPSGGAPPEARGKIFPLPIRHFCELIHIKFFFVSAANDSVII